VRRRSSTQACGNSITLTIELAQTCAFLGSSSNDSDDENALA